MTPIPISVSDYQSCESVVLSGLDGHSQGNLPVFLIRLKSLEGPMDVSFCSKSFPTEPPDPQMTQILFKPFLTIKLTCFVGFRSLVSQYPSNLVSRIGNLKFMKK